MEVNFAWLLSSWLQKNIRHVGKSLIHPFSNRVLHTRQIVSSHKQWMMLIAWLKKIKNHFLTKIMIVLIGKVVQSESNKIRAGIVWYIYRPSRIIKIEKKVKSRPRQIKRSSDSSKSLKFHNQKCLPNSNLHCVLIASRSSRLWADRRRWAVARCRN